MEADFEWDPNKNRANIAKHGIDFKNVVPLFQLDPVISPAGPRTDGESRWIATGRLDERTIIVVFTMRSDSIRLISARPASRRERRLYHRSRRVAFMSLSKPPPLWDESKEDPDSEIDFSDIPEIEDWEVKYFRLLSDPEARSQELWDKHRAEWEWRKRERETATDIEPTPGVQASASAS